MAGINDGGGSGFKTRRDAYDEQQNNLQTMLFKAGSEDKENKLKQLLQSGAQAHDLTKQQGEWAHDKQTSEDAEKRARGIVDDLGGKGIKASASVGKDGSVAITQNETDPATRMAGQVRQEGNALYKAGNAKFGPLQERAVALENVHKSLDDPTSVDQKSLSASLARLAEGKGQRLLAPVLKAFDADSFGGDVTKGLNYISGKAGTGYTSDQLNAMRQFVIKHGDELGQETEGAKQQFGQQATLLAPTLAATGQLNQHIPNFTTQLEGSLGRLKERRDAYAKQGGAQNLGAQSPQNAPQYNQPMNLLDQLKAKVGLGTAPAAAPTMSFEEFKKKKASGEL